MFYLKNVGKNSLWRFLGLLIKIKCLHKLLFKLNFVLLLFLKKGNTWEDAAIVACCSPCAACQIRRELQYHGLAQWFNGNSQN